VTRFATEALRRDHPRESFTCGVDALDRYLRELALQDVKRLMAGCFVAVDETGDIGGYYTLAATHVPVDDLPPETTRKLPRYPVIPAMLIGRLAVAAKHRGRGLGRALVADAAIRTKGFGVGAFALIVEAKDQAAVAFYEANGFAPIPTETRRLFLPIATALALTSGNSRGQKP
jgi:GNAT superfamily N-acetyltransferase